MQKPEHDVVGYWTEVKLDIVRKYAAAYSAILNNQPTIKRHIYIDAFAGPGVHLSKRTGEYIAGSPLNAFNVSPPFKEYHFVDMDGKRVKQLRKLCGNAANVFAYEGNCNEVLRKEVFARAKWTDFSRALCLLDPYGLHLDWEVVAEAGNMGTVEVFINFPIMDINMNVLHRDLKPADPEQATRMSKFWGDDSWSNAGKQVKKGLFGDITEKVRNDQVLAAYVDRLKKVAGFKFVPEAMPMRNSSGAVVYYLVFASPNRTGAKIVKEIFDSYRDRGVR